MSQEDRELVVVYIKDVHDQQLSVLGQWKALQQKRHNKQSIVQSSCPFLYRGLVAVKIQHVHHQQFPAPWPGSRAYVLFSSSEEHVEMVQQCAICFG